MLKVAGLSNQKLVSPQLDGLRGAASLWVVLFHYLFFLNAASRFNLGIFQSFVSKGYLGVDVFFILSGFIISYSYADFFQENFNYSNFALFIKNRIARIYPSYFLALIVLLFFFLFGSLKPYAVNFAVFDLKYFFLNLFMIQSWFFQYSQWSWNLPGWSVSVEWILYLIFPCLPLLFFKNRSLIFLFLVVGIAYFLLLYLIETNEQFFIMKGMEFGIARGGLEFVIGCSLYLVSNKIEMLFSKKYAGDFLGLLAIIGIIFTTNFDYKWANELSIFFMTLLVPSLFLSKKWLKAIFSFSWMGRLGKISYTIYVLQFPYQIISNHLFKHAPTNPAYVLHLAAYASQVALLVIMSSIVYVFYERPIREMIKKLKLPENKKSSLLDSKLTDQFL